MAVWGGLTDRWEKKRHERQRRKGKKYPFEADFQRIARRDKKTFLSDQGKEIEENNRMGKTTDLFKKIRDTNGTFHASSVQFSSVAQSRLTLCNPTNCGMPGLPVHYQLLEFTQTHVHWVGDAIQPSHPLSSRSPPAFNLSQHQGLFKWVSSSHQGPKYWSFSFSISPPNEYSVLISFRMDLLDLFAVQGTLKSLLQHHSSKPSILHSAFFTVQFSHPYMTTGKTIALTRWTFFAKMGTTKDKWYGPNRSRRY